MEIRNYTLNEFAELGEQEQTDFLIICRLSAMPFSVNNENITFGKVKELQMLFGKEQNFEAIKEIISYATDKEIVSAYYFFSIYYGIEKEIVSITEKENTIMSKGVDSKAITASEKVGGFEMFGRFPEIYNLCNGDYEKAFNLPYSIGFTIMAYKKKMYDFEREYYKLK